MGAQTEQFERELERVEEQKSAFVNPDNADAIIHMAKAYDPDNMLVDVPDGEQTNAPSTLENYVQKCRRFAKDVDLLNTSELELKELLQQYKDGEHPSVKDGGSRTGASGSIRSGSGNSTTCTPTRGSTRTNSRYRRKRKPRLIRTTWSPATKLRNSGARPGTTAT